MQHIGHERATVLKDTGLDSLQHFNRATYGALNDQHFDNRAMTGRLLRYSIQVLRLARKGDTKKAGYYLSVALSWSFALANRLHINLKDRIWKKYQGICPECSSVPCVCPPNESKPENALEPLKQPETLKDLQRMLDLIYPNNTLNGSILHLAEEIGELVQSTEYFHGTHDERFLDQSVENLVDVVASICAVATCFDLDLAAEFENHFKFGCPKCQKSPCTSCGFTTAKII